MPHQSLVEGGLKPLAFNSLKFHLDPLSHIAWAYMRASPRQCFTPQLLREIAQAFVHVATLPPDIAEAEFLVLASDVPGIFNLGGDLALFKEKIEKQDREQLQAYGQLCVEALYLGHAHPGTPNLTSIALVQGDALGGGFEAALATNIIVAERSARMGFPEILFNLFPGMGATTFLGRKIGFQKAEKMILGGKLYAAEELHEMGVVDILAEDGEGLTAVLEYIRRMRRSMNGTLAARAARDVAQPVSLNELNRIVEIWVDAALRITDKDLSMMARLVSRQNGKALRLA